MTPLERLALALHECDLDAPCKAKGAERQRHINAYLKVAQGTVDRLANRWLPANPPSDVMAPKRTPEPEPIAMGLTS